MSALRFSSHGATDVGLVREGNEDNLYVGTTVFAVADGMGGHQAGEIASQKALEPVADLDRSQFATAEEAQEALVEAITAANASVVAEGAADPSKSGMGTTLTAVLLRSGRLHLAHVGDSRAYLLRDGERISQLTTDHTLVEQLIQEGRISREQAATHPQRSVITRAIGVDREVEVDSFPPLELQSGDQVLLCSDGLTGPVSDERISAILNAEPDGDEACATLIDAAKEGGGPDNITVVLLRIAGPRAGRAAGPVDDGASTGPLPAPVPTPDGAKARTSEGTHAINTRAEPDTTTNWAERMGRYGRVQGADTQPPRSRRRGRLAATVLGVAVLLALLGGGGYALLSRSFFVGDLDGEIAIFNGVPQSVLGLPLYWERERTDLATDDLPPFRAEQVREGVTAPTFVEARKTVENYRDQIEERQAPDVAPTRSPTEDATSGSGGATSPASPPPTSTPTP